jgi:hypothetical protein
LEKDSQDIQPVAGDGVGWIARGLAELRQQLDQVLFLLAAAGRRHDVYEKDVALCCIHSYGVMLAFQSIHRSF